MGKKLITVSNYREYVSGDKLEVTKDFILTAGAKDELRKAGVTLVYDTCSCKTVKKETKSNGNDGEVVEKIVEILVKDFNITDEEQIKLVLEKISKYI